MAPPSARLAPSAAEDARARIERLYDHLYANGRIRRPEAICAEVSKLLHTAQFLEQDRGLACAFALGSSEVADLLRSGGHDSRRPIAAEVHAAFERMNAAWGVYGPEEVLRLSDADLAFACACLDGVRVSTRERDLVGDAVEIFRTQWTKRNGGQFFTDPLVTALAMELLDYSPEKGETLVDPCAGTGGFLLAALGVLRDRLEGSVDPAQLDGALRQGAAGLLAGQEADEKVCAIANASLAARLGGGAGGVAHGDSLQPDQVLVPGSFDCAASNPPFGTKTTVKDPRVLAPFDLAKLGGRSAGTRASALPPDVLFLEQNTRLVRPGSGRLAIVLPYQIVSGPATRYVREWLLRHLKVQALVDLPPDTFQPHTGTKACLLVATRRRVPAKSLAQVRPYRLFLSSPRWIGHDRRGRPVYRRAPDGSTTGELLTDIPDVGRAFQAFRAGHDPASVHPESFTLSATRILDDPELRLNARYHTRADWLRSAPPDGRVRWTQARLGDLVERVFCPGRFRRRYVDPGPHAVPFLGGTNASQFVVETAKFLAPDDPILARVRVHAGWILVTRSGSTGIVSVVPRAWDGWAVSEHVIRIVPDPARLSPGYLYAYLKTARARAQLAQGVFGSVIDEITPDYLADLQVALPDDPEVRDRIARSVEHGEAQRNAALGSILEGIDALDELLRP